MVPCASQLTSSSFAASSSNTSMNTRPMILRLASGSASPRKRSQEALLGIDADDVHAHVLGEGRHHLIALAEPQQAVIDEYAGELRADRAVQERRQHRGIDAARQPEQHLVAADLRADARDAVLDDVAGGPARAAAGDLAHEAAQDLAALQGVGHLGMELQRVQSAATRPPSRRAAHCRSPRSR